MDIKCYKKGSKDVVWDFIVNIDSNQDKRKIVKDLDRL